MGSCLLRASILCTSGGENLKRLAPGKVISKLDAGYSQTWCEIIASAHRTMFQHVSTHTLCLSCERHAYCSVLDAEDISLGVQVIEGLIGSHRSNRPDVSTAF
jgi:hypothetical protein